MNVIRSSFASYVVILCLSTSLAVLQYDCRKYRCPSEQQPLCTPVGCVSTCPKGSFERDKQCVITCGDGYVVGDHCQDECPAEASYVVEKIVVNDGYFEKLRICVNICSDYDPTLASFKGKCVQCPSNSSFQLDNVCISRCPLSHPYWFNFEIPERHFSVIQCRDHCPMEKFIVSSDNRTCVNTCLKEEVVFDLRCTKACPNDSYVLLNDRCVLTCPSDMLLQNKTCVYQCDRSINYVYNSTCQTKCPSNMPYFDHNNDGQNYCKQSCGDHFSQDWKCVTKCSKGYYEFKKTCVSSCPPSAPYNEKQDTWYDDEDHYVCVPQCSSGEVAVNFTCLYECPNKQYAYNNTCTDHCPETAPYLSYDLRWCLDHCQSDQFVNNFTCVLECPHLAFHNICVSTCPNNTFWMDKTCYSECPEATFIFNDTECRDCALHDLKTCVDSCPRERPYNDDGNCATQCPNDKVSDIRSCIDEYDCKRNVVYDGKCLDSCPKGTTVSGTGSYSIDNRQINGCSNKTVTNTYIAACLVIFGVMAIICVVYFRFWPLPYFEKKIGELFQRRNRPVIVDTGADNHTIQNNDDVTSDTVNLIA